MAVRARAGTLVNVVALGLLEGTRATANLRPERVGRAAAGALLKKAAEKDDCTDRVTGQTVVVDSGRLFH